MTLRLAGDDIEEVRRAVSSAYCEVIRELAETSGFGAAAAAIQLCRRKWTLEAVLRQLEAPEGPPAALHIIPARKHSKLECVAA